jgi:hypothetical protein
MKNGPNLSLFRHSAVTTHRLPLMVECQVVQPIHQRHLERAHMYVQPLAVFRVPTSASLTY